MGKIDCMASTDGLKHQSCGPQHHEFENDILQKCLDTYELILLTNVIYIPFIISKCRQQLLTMCITYIGKQYLRKLPMKFTD